MLRLTPRSHAVVFAQVPVAAHGVRRRRLFRALLMLVVLPVAALFPPPFAWAATPCETKTAFEAAEKALAEAEKNLPPRPESTFTTRTVPNIDKDIAEGDKKYGTPSVETAEKQWKEAHDQERAMGQALLTGGSSEVKKLKAEIAALEANLKKIDQEIAAKGGKEKIAALENGRKAMASAEAEVTAATGGTVDETRGWLADASHPFTSELVKQKEQKLQNAKADGIASEIKDAETELAAARQAARDRVAQLIAKFDQARADVRKADPDGAIAKVAEDRASAMADLDSKMAELSELGPAATATQADFDEATRKASELRAILDWVKTKRAELVDEKLGAVEWPKWSEADKARAEAQTKRDELAKQYGEALQKADAAAADAQKAFDAEQQHIEAEKVKIRAETDRDKRMQLFRELKAHALKAFNDIKARPAMKDYDCFAGVSIFIKDTLEPRIHKIEQVKVAAGQDPGNDPFYQEVFGQGQTAGGYTVTTKSKKVTVRPGGWVASGVKLKPGQMVSVNVEGTVKRPTDGAVIGPGGYGHLGFRAYTFKGKLGKRLIEIGASGAAYALDNEPAGELMLATSYTYEPNPEDAKFEGQYIATVSGTADIEGLEGGDTGSGGSGSGTGAPPIAGGGSGSGDTLAPPIRHPDSPLGFSIGCPVMIEVTDAQNRKAAMGPDGKIANAIPGAEVIAEPDGAGGHRWFGGLPQGQYAVTLTATDSGKFQLRSKQRGTPDHLYPVVTLDKGGTATVTLSDQGAPQPLRTGQTKEFSPTAVPGEGGPTASGAGSGAGVAPGQPPPEISTGKNLQLARWHTLRRITNFPRGEEAKFIRSTKISPDGSRIAFAAAQGLFTISPDGSNLVRISDKPCALMDISADGNRVAWHEGGRDDLFVANADGSGREKMPAGLYVVSMRLTADGSKLFVLVPEKGGIFMLPADGSDVKKVVSTADPCKLLETPENGNHWRTLDISDDGSKIAFQLLFDLFTVNGDGSDLRRITKHKDYTVTANGYRISGDGRKLIYATVGGEKAAMVFCDAADGGNAVTFPRPHQEFHSLHPMTDGSRVAGSFGVRLLDADGKTYYDALDLGAHAVHNPYSVSLTRDFRRAVIQIDGPVSVDQGGPSQLAVIDFNPASSIVGCPAIREINAKPKFLPNDFSTGVTVMAAVADPEIQQLGVTLVRNGARDPDMPTFFPLVDNGTAGDEKAGDGIFSNNGIIARTYSGKPAPPGPVTLRIHAMDKTGNITVADLEGLEIRQP